MDEVKIKKRSKKGHKVKHSNTNGNVLSQGIVLCEISELCSQDSSFQRVNQTPR
jgi:hypothetical protein